jgi:hypothetical protein
MFWLFHSQDGNFPEESFILMLRNNKCLYYKMRPYKLTKISICDQYPTFATFVKHYEFSLNTTFKYLIILISCGSS